VAAGYVDENPEFFSDKVSAGGGQAEMAQLLLPIYH
jgi:hypothetical protein